MLQALIFDVDGTLADTERDGHRIAFNQAFAAAGLPWNWTDSQYAKLLAIAGGKERIRFYRNQEPPDFRPEGAFAGDLTAFIAQLHASKNQYYSHLMAAGKIPARPGVRRLLQEARQQGIRLAIATTSSPENVMTLLTTALAPDSPDWFEVIAAGDIVPAKKPAPDIYHYVLQKMQLQPDACLVIEDSQQGLQAATQAGLKTVVTVNGYTRDQDFAKAALVLDHLGEPDLPFRAIAGNIDAATYFDIALARTLHAKLAPCF